MRVQAAPHTPQTVGLKSTVSDGMNLQGTKLRKASQWVLLLQYDNQVVVWSLRFV